MAGNGNGNGNGRKPTDYSDLAIEVMIVGVVFCLVGGFVIKWLTTEVIDSQMYKEVLIFVLGSVVGTIGQKMAKKISPEPGTTVVSPPSGTTVVTPPPGGSVTVKDDKK